LDVGANLFIGSLSTEVDERLLYDTFSRFGAIVTTPKIMRDPETGESKGFAFVSFSDFESSDASIAALNGQYLAGRPISVAYAIKKVNQLKEEICFFFFKNNFSVFFLH
jgi:splicing factor 3B subunit 4